MRARGTNLALEVDLGLEAAALLHVDHDAVLRQLHHRALRDETRIFAWDRAGWLLDAPACGEERGAAADLMLVPADAGEGVDHAMDAVQHADEVRRVVALAGRRRGAHPRSSAGPTPRRCWILLSRPLFTHFLPSLLPRAKLLPHQFFFSIF